MSCRRFAAQSPWQRHGCNTFQQSSCCDKACVACALYCDNRLCWGARGTTLDPRPTHFDEGGWGVFLVPRQRGYEQTQNGSILLSPPGFTKQFREKQNLVMLFYLVDPLPHLCYRRFHCDVSFYCHFQLHLYLYMDTSLHALKRNLFSVQKLNFPSE